MPDTFEDILDQAENLTNKELDAKISSLIRLKDTELVKFFPTKTDKEKLIKLMQIVQAATSDSVKKNKLVENISDVADTVVKLLMILG